MTAIRQKPVINPGYDSFIPPKPDNESMGCVIVPIGIVISYFIASAIARVSFNSATNFDKFICYGTFAVVGMICLLGIRQMFQEQNVREENIRKWAKACATDQLKIVSRNGGTWDDGYKFHTSYWLELEMNPDQKAIAPYDTIVSVKVWESLYKKLEKQDTVRIYYKPDAPLTFLLEEEI